MANFRIEMIEALHFDSHEEARVMINPGVQAFLIRATKAAVGGTKCHRLKRNLLSGSHKLMNNNHHLPLMRASSLYFSFSLA